MNYKLKMTAVAGAVCVALMSSGCSTIGPTLTGGVDIYVANHIRGSKVSDEEDLQFNISGIFGKGVGSVPSMQKIEGRTFDAIGDEAVRIVSKHSYDEIKAFVKALGKDKIIYPTKNQGMLIDVDPHVAKAEFACGFNYSTEIKRGFEDKKRFKMMHEMCNKKLTEIREELFERYGQPDLLTVYAYWHFRSEAASRYAFAEGPDFFNTGIYNSNAAKRKIALGILLSAYEDAVGHDVKIPGTNKTIRDYLVETFPTRFTSVSKIQSRGLSYVFWHDRTPLSFMFKGKNYCGSPWLQVPMNQKIAKTLLTSREPIGGINLDRMLSNFKKELPDKTFIFGGSLRSFMTDPEAYGIGNYAKIVARRDQDGYPVNELDVDACASRYAELVNTEFTKTECIAYEGKYSSSSSLCAATSTTKTNAGKELGLDHVQIAQIFANYISAWGKEVYEKERTSYKFR